MLGVSSYSSSYYCSDYLKDSLKYRFNVKEFIEYIWEKIKIRKVLGPLENK